MVTSSAGILSFLSISMSLGGELKSSWPRASSSSSCSFSESPLPNKASNVLGAVLILIGVTSGKALR